MTLKSRLHEIIFEADTAAGRVFDIVLIVSVVTSVVVVLLTSVASIEQKIGPFLHGAEYFFTALFTIEYLLRIYAVKRPLGYIFSFFGIVDLLAVLPTYLRLFLPGSQYLLTIRILRVLRIFRVFKLAPYLVEVGQFKAVIKASSRRIAVFLLGVLTLVVMLGSVMYIIEDAASGFTSIPRSIYWAVVTLTTVGYGDISPQTALGQAVAAVIMVLGYSIIVVSAGYVSVAAVTVNKKMLTTQACPACCAEGHDADALYCKFCGCLLNDPPE